MKKDPEPFTLGWYQQRAEDLAQRLRREQEHHAFTRYDRDQWKAQYDETCVAKNQAIHDLVLCLPSDRDFHWVLRRNSILTGLFNPRNLQ